MLLLLTIRAARDPAGTRRQNIRTIEGFAASGMLFGFGKKVLSGDTVMNAHVGSAKKLFKYN